MRLSIADAFSSALDAAREFRWAEYAPFFWILAVQLAVLALATQLQSDWAMGLMAPLVKLVGGEGFLHYPVFFGYLPTFLGWVENFLYVVPGAVLIPLMLLRFYSRSDRALSLGAGATSRLMVAFFPTLLGGVIGVGAVLAWQRYAAGPLTALVNGRISAPLGPMLSWTLVTLGVYAIISLMLYIPVAAVQARTNPIRAFAYGIRFGLRSWPLTLGFAVLFGLPALFVQFLLEKQSALLLTRLRPEFATLFLGVYVSVTSVATYFTYGAAARLYKFARGEE